MSTKPLNSFAPGKGKREAQESERVNNYDRDSSTNPNAQGPVARPVEHQCAGIPNYPADGHDTYEKPYPRVQHGAAFVGIGSPAERRDGAGGSW